MVLLRGGQTTAAQQDQPGAPGGKQGAPLSRAQNDQQCYQIDQIAQRNDQRHGIKHRQVFGQHIGQGEQHHGRGDKGHTFDRAAGGGGLVHGLP